MRLKLWKRDKEFEVWTYLEPWSGDPADWPESFIIGTGATAPQAIAAAQRELRHAIAALRVRRFDQAVLDG